MPTPPPPSLSIPDLPLHDYVLAGADARGDTPALACGASGRSLSYRDLARGVRHLAAGLMRSGVTKGDVVAIMAPNCPEYPVVFHAVSRAGGILTTINPS